jgi:hypothetical protein
MNLEDQINDNINIEQTEARTKQETAEVIEAMLNEIGMSQQDLIDLLVGGIKLEKHVEIEVASEILINIQNLSPEDLENLGIEGADVQALKTAIEQGRDKFKIFEFFTFAKILSLLSKVSVMFNLEILKRLGFEVSPFEIQQLLKIQEVKDIDTKNLRIQLANSSRILSQPEIDKLKNYSQDKLSNVSQQQGVGQNTSNSSQKRTAAMDQSQQNQAASQIQNDNVQASSGQVGRAAQQVQQQQQMQQQQQESRQQQRSMSRGLRWLRERTREITNRVKDSLNKVERKVESVSFNIAINQADQLQKALAEFGNKVKDTYHEVNSVQFKGREIFVTTHAGEQYNIRDFLQAKGHYNPEMKRLVDEAGAANAELLKILGNLQKRMTKNSETTFGDARTLMVQADVTQSLTKLNVLDYLQDVKKFLSGQDSKQDVNLNPLGEKSKGESKQKNSESKFREKTKDAKSADGEGAGKDKKSDGGNGSSDQAQDKGFGMPIIIDVVAKAAEIKEIKITSEVEDLRKDLIKLDAMSDARKHLAELQEAKSLFSKGVSAMGEAMKNNTKEVMKEMKEKMQTNKEINK